MRLEILQWTKHFRYSVRRQQPSKELLELLNRESSVTHDPAHGKGVDWIGTGERENAAAIGHDNVLAFASDIESSLLERPDGIAVIDARESGH